MKKIYLFLLTLFAFFTSKAQENTPPLPDRMPAFSTPMCDSIADQATRQKCQMDAMYDFIIENLNYPPSAYKKNIQGMVVISFTVEKDGTISKASIAKDLEEGCGEEALRVINAFPKWHFAIQDGKPVAVKMNLPITFSKVGWKKKKEDKYEAAKQDTISIGKQVDLSQDTTIYPYKELDEVCRYLDLTCEVLTDKEERELCAQKRFFTAFHKGIRLPMNEIYPGGVSTTVVRFVVEKDGSLSNASIIRSVHPDFDAEILRNFTTLTTRFQPAKINGQFVRSYYHLPVKFHYE